MAQDDATLKSQYLTKITDDLEYNEKERERITAEIAALQATLLALEGDHTLLLGMQQALAGQDTGAANGSAKASVTAAAARPKKTTGTPVRKGRPRSAPAAQPAKSPGAQVVTLRDLVLAHLSALSEPASAAEVASQLGQAHPERSIQVTVVRNTLEGLVAKGHASRSKQKRSVFYTAHVTSDMTPATEPNGAAS